MSKPAKLLYLLALIKLILPFLLQHSFYQPHRDEYLYLAEGHHLAWGYMEIPPLLSVFAWITNAFGGGMFWIKIWPSLFGAFTFILVGRSILNLGGKYFALILGWLPFVVDGYLRLFYLFMPNFLDVFFWTAMAYSLVRYIQTERRLWIYAFGLAVGLGMMSKYSTAFYAASLVIGLLLTRHRRLFLRKEIYLAAGIALLIFLPNLFWQYQHRFPVIHHMQELQDEQLRFIGSVDFLKSQLLNNFPCVYIWITGLIAVLFFRNYNKYRFIGWAYFAVIALLLAGHGKPYYALGAYPVLFAFGAVHLEQFTRQRVRWLRYAMLIFSLGFGLFALPLVLPVARPAQLVTYYKRSGLWKTGDFKWEDQQRHPLPQDFADMMGWREIAQKTAAIYHSLPPGEQQQTAIFARGYYTTGAINYYGTKLNIPEAISDNASFLFWLPDSTNIRNLLLVAHNIPGKDDIVFQQFQKMTVRDSITMPLFRENGIRFILFEQGNDSLNPMIKEAIRKLKDQYRR